MDFWEAAINVYDRIRNYFEEEEDEDTDEERYQEQLEESRNRFRLTREDALSQFDRAYQLQRDSMNQTQFNYENATQIRSADMQAAGLNPLNLVGGAEGQTLSSSLSPSASALNSPLPSGRRNSNPQVSGTSTAAGLLDYYFRHKENEADRKNAKDIAQIQADAQKDSAASSLEGTKYSSDLGYSAKSEENDIARLKVVNDKVVRDAELLEKKYEFDTNLEKDVRQFNANVDIEYNKLRLGLYETNSANARTLANLSTEQFKAALNAYTNAIRNSVEFALGINRLKLDYDKFLYTQEKDKKELALKNTQIALDNATKQMQSITGLAGDICKSFIIGTLSSGRR